jgi:DNA invertase Pin-like site-specific DNA recombinase
MPTFFVYCRKSIEAEDRQILSIDSQISELKRHAVKKGLTIAPVLTEATSAKAPGRPAFNSMMDRLARNPVDEGAIIWAMKKYGVRIIAPFHTYGSLRITLSGCIWKSVWPKNTSLICAYR